MTIDELTEKAWRTVEADEIIGLAKAMVNIPSPSGEEQALAEFLVDFMKRQGLDGILQPVNPGQANAIGKWQGLGRGPDLLLYSPIDTAFAGRQEEDDPWIDLDERPDQVAHATYEDGVLRGLGAHNPKGHAACTVMAAVALARADIRLSGLLTVALCAGGMPTNHRPGLSGAHHIGHGAGCAHFLEQGGRADAAIVAKPGPPSWEEVGVSWFKVRIKGLLGYAGTRHTVRHQNPILDAAKVIDEIERWLPEYTRANTSGLVAPQGSIGSIHAGWPYKPTFIPAACDIWVDLRTSPRVSAADVRRQFGDAMTAIQSRHPGMDLSWEMTLAVPGSHTDPNHPVIQAAIRSWEFITGAPYKPQPGGSGATETNVLRLWGVPAARMGMLPPPRPMRFSGQFSMGEAHVDSMTALTRALIRAAVDFGLRGGTD